MSETMRVSQLVKHVRLIRHGESAANAGEPSLDHASIPLTPKGVEQARQVAGSFAQAPDLIVASPFSRAQATAMETVAAFPSVSFEIWPIHKFTYLEPARCINTTVGQRRDWVDSYWAKADPTFIDGEGAESYLGFIHRALSFLNRLTEHPAHDICVFAHGQFINAVAWLIERNPQEIDGRAMADWRVYEIANHVPNCGGCFLSKSPDIDALRVNRPSDLTTDDTATLSAREVCQVLREVIFGRCAMTKVGEASWDEIYAGHTL